MIRTSAALVLTLLVGVAACSTDTSSLEGRIAALEAELDARPALGDLIVVGTEIEPVGRGGQVCVSYRAFDAPARTCITFSEGDIERADACLRDVTIGKPLPASCGGNPP